MQNLFKLLLLTGVLTLSLSARAQINTALLTKKWKISCQAVIDKMDGPQRTAFEQQNTEEKASFRSQVEMNTFEFNADSSYATHMTGSMTYQGTWRVSTPSHGNYQVHIYLGKHEIIYHIDRLTATELVLTRKDDPAQQLILTPTL